MATTSHARRGTRPRNRLVATGCRRPARMNLGDLRIGYVPYSPDLTQPGDRRRFCHYAAKRKLRFEIARPEERYDLVVLSSRGDLSVWADYRPGQAWIVYDLIDSYLAIPDSDLK